MSRRSKARKVADPRRAELAKQYNRRYGEWYNREPSRWRIFAWLKWKRERPYKPKWIDEYIEILDKYGWRYKYGR